MVYFIRIPDGRIKIGTAVDFRRRSGDLRRKYGGPVVLLALIPGCPLDEDEIHDRFKAIRFPKTELFRPTEDLLRFIDDLPEPVVRHLDDDRVNEMPLDHERVNDRWVKKNLAQAYMDRLRKRWSEAVTVAS